MIDLAKYDADLRAGTSAYDVAYRAQCSPQSVYFYMRKHGIRRDLAHRQGNRTTKEYRKPYHYDYLGWLKGEIKKLGIDGMLYEYWAKDYLVEYRKNASG